jgi:hypothetical protein
MTIPSSIVAADGNLYLHCTMSRYAFQLHISSTQYLDYYRGTVRNVLVRATSGQMVQFPASLLQRFVTPDGIHGDFVLVCDDQNKCLSLQRVPPAD